MAKAINWPQEFYEEIKNEDSTSPRIALRLGEIYFDNGYYANGEVVDIRVDHKITRKAVIIDDLKLYQIKDLPENIILMNKNSLKSRNELVKFLAKNYNQQVNDETTVTVITYKNLPFENQDILDDPHAS